MLKLYDKAHEPAGYIKTYKDMKIESVASTGDKTLSFTYMGKKDIETEYYIQTQEDEYVVKERTQSMDGFPQYVAVLNLEELEGKPWGSFSAKESTVDEAARLALAGTGWTVGECDVKKKRNAGMLKVTSRDIIEKLAVAFLCEIVYDTKNKTVSFYNEVGEDKGAYFIRGLNLKKLSKKSDSYDYYTQIIPIGANNLTIEKVNDGKNYLENYQYSDKKRTYIWKEESYTDAQALKEDAELKLQDLSKPAESYSVTVADLAKQKKQYSILEYHVGDKIWIIDSATRTRVKQRIVKMTEYPQSPEKNTCEIANTVLTFEELQQKYKEAAEIVNTVVAGDGRYTGTVNVSDILNFEKGLTDSDVVSGMQSELDTLNKSLGEVKLTVGTIETNYLKVEDADIKYANIDFSNIGKAQMEYFYAKSGLIKNVEIGDATITGELVGVTIKGDLIDGNTVKADKLVIKGEDGLYYKLNTDGMTVEKEQTDYNSIDGQVIRAKSITATKIDVKDLVAFGATIGGFHIGDDSIYSGVKESIDNATCGIYMDMNGQIAFGDNEQYVKFCKLSDGKYRMSIALDELCLKGSNVSEKIDNAQETAESAAKTATNFLAFGDDGVTVGDQRGEALGRNVNIGSESINIRNGNTVLASFAEQLIELGKENPEATISLLNGLAKMVSSKSDENDTFLDIFTNYAISIGVNPKNSDDNTANLYVEDGAVSLNNKLASLMLGNGLHVIVYGFSGLDPRMEISANQDTGKNKVVLDNANGSKINMDGDTTKIESGTMQIAGRQNEMTASVDKYTAYTRVAADSTGCAINNSVIGVNKTLIQQWDNQIRFLRGKSTADVTTYSSENNKEWDLKAIYSGGTPVLASVALWPNASHTINLSMPVSVQPHGIVVEFAPYKDSKAQTYGYVTFFVPKARANGSSMCFTMSGSNFETPCTKWLYIHNTKIVGNDVNAQKGSNNGITYNNTKYVLTKVYGV